MSELVVAGKGELESDAERLDGHDGNRADCGTNGEVDEGILFAMNRRDPVDHEECKGNDSSSI